MQFISRLMDFYLTKDKKNINILGATSGDTGSAAIYGFQSIKSSNVFILHPYNLISPTQRKFMTTVSSKNIFNKLNQNFTISIPIRILNYLFFRLLI